MAAVDPYSPCPCGSGKKFKWCCHKVEAQADRAQRLFENGQTDAAIETLDEGLRKEPGNAWLLMRKATYLLRSEQPAAAMEPIRLVLRRDPKHLAAQALLTRLILETEGPAPAAAQLQQAITNLPDEDRPALAGLAQLIGMAFKEEEHYEAALAHLGLITTLLGEEIRDDGRSPLELIEGDPDVSPWQKQTYTLAPTPSDAPGPVRERFEQALKWAGDGLWSSASSAFELLAADPATSHAAERNLGLCRLWMAEDADAAQGLRRHISRLGTAIEAVDLEALCQEVAPDGPDDEVEHVRLVWPVRDREGLEAALDRDPSIEKYGSGPIDPDEEEGEQYDYYHLLDRPLMREKPASLRAEDVPRLLGRAFVGGSDVVLQTFDDGRLDALIDRFTTLAGSTIAPAHPKTNVIEKVPRNMLALSWEWRLPDDTGEEETARLNREQGARLIREVWPVTPQPYLVERTPLAAAKAGDAAVPLRAALLQLEVSSPHIRDLIDFAALRARLGIAPEPAIAPESAEIDQLPLSRLWMVPADRLDDHRLAALYHRARHFKLLEPLENAARVLVDRPGCWEAEGIEVLSLFSDLAWLASHNGRTAESLDWIRRGRQADPSSSLSAHAAAWDMLEIRNRAQSESPEAWVPELVAVLDRYPEDKLANESIMAGLLALGLVQVVPNPDRPREMMIDPRRLQYLISRFGPRVTTASGELGVSATRGGLWTPGGTSGGGGGGGIWTPGSETAAAPGGQDKPKLIIPGR